jgi:crotonobetainyl-CoA:carnitine CoA-transferase CaiB-like acyl-CoA transferase
LSGPLLATQTGSPAKPIGNRSDRYTPHGAWRCAGEDAWISLAIRDDAEWRALCRLVPGLTPLADLDFKARVAREVEIDAGLTEWMRPQDAAAVERVLMDVGVPAAGLANSVDLVNNKQLRARRFWDEHGSGVVPGLPWRASFGRAMGPAPALGADTESVLRTISRSSP